MRGKKYLKYLNPFFYIRKRITRKLEFSEWGGLEDRGIDFVAMDNENVTNHSRYQITRPQHLTFIRDYLAKCRISSKDAIIDIGCGKGALLWVFSKYPFGHIAGLEYSKALCEICSENMKKLDLDVDIINGDANFYNDYDRYNYMYLYNPFQSAIMTNFIHNLHESIVRSSRKVRIIYTNPVCLEDFLRSGFLVEEEFATDIYFKEKAVVLTNRIED